MELKATKVSLIIRIRHGSVGNRRRHNSESVPAVRGPTLRADRLEWSHALVGWRVRATLARYEFL